MTPEYIGLADYIVLGVYFLVLVAIGLYCARLNKRQEDSSWEVEDLAN